MSIYCGEYPFGGEDPWKDIRCARTSQPNGQPIFGPDGKPMWMHPDDEAKAEEIRRRLEEKGK